MSDKKPPGRGDIHGESRPLDADLDAALWPASSGEIAETTPAGTASGRRPARLAAVPAETVPAGTGPAETRPVASAQAVATQPPAARKQAAGDTHSPPAQARARSRRPARGRPPGMSAREWLRMERARQARRKRRIRLTAIGTCLAALIGAATAGVLIRQQHTAARAGHVFTGHYAPVTLNADNSVTMARAGVTTPVLDVFEDFQCAQCRAFERGNGRMIQRLADEGKVKVVYHPFTIFSGQLQQASSIRAWAAAKCAPANRWVSYHNALYASQPAAGTAGGFTLSLLVHLGREAGIAGPGFAQCVRSQQYAALNAPLSNQVLNGGVNSAPVIVLNGKMLGISPLSSRLRQQILSASRS